MLNLNIKYRCAIFLNSSVCVCVYSYIHHDEGKESGFAI